MYPIILVIGNNTKKIEYLCNKIRDLFLISKQVKNAVIVHPKFFLEFVRDDIENKIFESQNVIFNPLPVDLDVENESKIRSIFKNIYCFNRVKKIIFTNTEIPVIINNYFIGNDNKEDIIKSISPVEILIYNLNVLKTPITHILCESVYLKYFYEFKNIFELNYYNKNIGNEIKSYIFSAYYEIIDSALFHPKRTFFNVLIGWSQYKTLFKDVVFIIKRVYLKKIRKMGKNVIFESDNKNFKSMIDLVINQKHSNLNMFYLLFNYRKKCHLFNFMNYNIYILPRYSKIYKFIGNEYLLIEQINSKIGKLDFVIRERYKASGIISNKTSKYFENKIVRFI